MSADRVAFPPTLIGIELDPGQGLSKQLYEILRRQILDGRLSSGMRLPASRDLAKSLAISRNSVMRAFDSYTPKVSLKGALAMAHTSRNWPGVTLRFSAMLPENYPPTYPQVCTQGYAQVCPHLRLKTRRICRIKLSTTPRCNGLKSTTSMSPRMTGPRPLGSGFPRLTFSRSPCGASCMRLFGASQISINWAMALRRESGGCESWLRRIFAPREGWAVLLSKL
ncbi:Transcriptional regulator [Pseudomonas syringae pv. maculicola]|nr:Transcriptional regulator [Pseudomonas syringae pv. maculicola]